MTFLWYFSHSFIYIYSQYIYSDTSIGIASDSAWNTGSGSSQNTSLCTDDDFFTALVVDWYLEAADTEFKKLFIRTIL